MPIPLFLYSYQVGGSALRLLSSLDKYCFEFDR